MSPPIAPTATLATHVVVNQPPPLIDVDLYRSDRALREAVLREGGEWLDRRAGALGAAAGSARVLAMGDEANRHPPELVAFDRYGQRLDEVRFHPSYHALMALATEHRIHDLAWSSAEPGRHVAHAALLAIFAQAEAGTMCPINMTYAAVATLRQQPEVGAPWLARLIGGSYDAPLAPLAQKAGVTVGMAMTEKQGGSDVRANTTRAARLEEGAYRLHGHKWFCSAPMSDAFLTLAQAEGGLTCFLVPRVTPDATRNGIRLMRLKDKLGNRSNASAEIEYEGALAWRIGEEGRGVKAIIDMVHHTRLGTIACTLGLMRMALAQAVNHAAGRVAFGRPLIAQPAMATVLTDLALDYEAAVVLVMRIARAFGAEDESGRAFARLGVALAKYWLTQRCPGFVFACMECLGGAGYIEEGPMPRLFREAPLNAIWEGSGNVIALDVLRTLQREPAALDALLAEFAPARGLDAAFDRQVARVVDDLRGAQPSEAGARAVVERLALSLQAALLLRHAPGAVASSFIQARLGDARGFCYGGMPDGVDHPSVLKRQFDG